MNRQEKLSADVMSLRKTIDSMLPAKKKLSEMVTKTVTYNLGTRAFPTFTSSPAQWFINSPTISLGSIVGSTGTNALGTNNHSTFSAKGYIGKSA